MVSASIFGNEALDSPVATDCLNFSQCEFGLLNHRHNRLSNKYSLWQLSGFYV